MTPEEIRAQAYVPAAYDRQILFALYEIAAQLAEANEIARARDAHDAEMDEKPSPNIAAMAKILPQLERLAGVTAPKVKSS